jgi:hypothetical protein
MAASKTLIVRMTVLLRKMNQIAPQFAGVSARSAIQLSEEGDHINV